MITGAKQTLFDRIKDKILNMVLSREFVLILAIFVCGGVLIHRLFTLQIVNGASIWKTFSLPFVRSVPFRQRGAISMTETAGFSPTMNWHIP